MAKKLITLAILLFFSASSLSAEVRESQLGSLQIKGQVHELPKEVLKVNSQRAPLKKYLLLFLFSKAVLLLSGIVYPLSANAQVSPLDLLPKDSFTIKVQNDSFIEPLRADTLYQDSLSFSFPVMEEEFQQGIYVHHQDVKIYAYDLLYFNTMKKHELEDKDREEYKIVFEAVMTYDNFPSLFRFFNEGRFKDLEGATWEYDEKWDFHLYQLNKLESLVPQIRHFPKLTQYLNDFIEIQKIYREHLYGLDLNPHQAGVSIEDLIFTLEQYQYVQNVIPDTLVIDEGFFLDFSDAIQKTMEHEDFIFYREQVVEIWIQNYLDTYFYAPERYLANQDYQKALYRLKYVLVVAENRLKNKEREWQKVLHLDQEAIDRLKERFYLELDNAKTMKEELERMPPFNNGFFYVWDRATSFYFLLPEKGGSGSSNFEHFFSDPNKLFELVELNEGLQGSFQAYLKMKEKDLELIVVGNELGITSFAVYGNGKNQFFKRGSKVYRYLKVDKILSENKLEKMEFRYSSDQEFNEADSFTYHVSFDVTKKNRDVFVSMTATSTFQYYINNRNFSDITPIPDYTGWSQNNDLDGSQDQILKAA